MDVLGISVSLPLLSVLPCFLPFLSPFFSFSPYPSLQPHHPPPQKDDSKFKERADPLRPHRWLVEKGTWRSPRTCSDLLPASYTLFLWVLGFSLSLGLNIWQGLILSPQLRAPLTVLWRMLWKCLRISGWVSTAYGTRACVHFCPLSV